jgi:hypothetical protein
MWLTQYNNNLHAFVTKIRYTFSISKQFNVQYFSNENNIFEMTKDGFLGPIRILPSANVRSSPVFLHGSVL